MPPVYRITKARYPVFDGTGAYLEGGRWNSPGRPAVYGSTCLAGCLLEVLVHAGRMQRIPGAHHCARAEIPDDLAIEVVDEARLPGWDAADSSSARAYGDAWLAEGRSAVLSVPAAAARPLGRNLVLNSAHPDYGRIRPHPPEPLAWDARLFSV
jgi:RES domain-containing protein